MKKPWEETNLLGNGPKKDASTQQQDDIVDDDAQKDDEVTVAEAETLSNEVAPQNEEVTVDEDDIDEVL